MELLTHSHDDGVHHDGDRDGGHVLPFDWGLVFQCAEEWDEVD